MPLKRYGKDIASDEYWAEVNAGYADRMKNNYHAHRLGVVRSLLDDFDGEGAVVDFGCGEGACLNWYPSAKNIGIDPDKGLLDIAAQQAPHAELHLGGVEQLAEIQAESVTLVLSLNVNAYLSDEEDDLFYKEAVRILRPGGRLVITHSNELFDMFTMNAFTVDFFDRNFGTDVSPLLARPNEPDRVTFNIRENPLTYRFKLARHGLTETRQGFSNFHDKSPLLGKDMEHFADTIEVPDSERWKLMFQCSTYQSLSVK
jgi:SAM-dependent methyltransferase